MSLSEDDILDIEDIVKNCSPGPWYSSLSYSGKQLVICNQFFKDIVVCFDDKDFCSEEQVNNFLLMARSRELIPELIEEIRSLRKKLNKT